MATNTLTDNLDNQPSEWASVPLVAVTDRVRGGLDGAPGTWKRFGAIEA